MYPAQDTWKYFPQLRQGINGLPLSTWYHRSNAQIIHLWNQYLESRSDLPLDEAGSSHSAQNIQQSGGQSGWWGMLLSLPSSTLVASTWALSSSLQVFLVYSCS